MKYKCVNKECNFYDVEFEFFSAVYHLRDGKLVSDSIQCPYCGTDRVEINEGEKIPICEKNISINEFSSLSKEDRIASLKSRSHQHFKKNIESQKREKINNAVKNFKSV